MTLFVPCEADIPIVISHTTLGGYYQLLVIFHLFIIAELIALPSAVRKPATSLVISIKP